MLRIVTPHATAYAARCKPHDLRDWRRHGFLDGYGDRDGKGHLYSVHETARIAIAALIARAGLSMRDAFTIVRERSSQIDALTGLVEQPNPNASDYVLTLGIDPDVTTGFASVTGAPLANVSIDNSLPIAVQINISLIVRSVIDRIAFHDRHIARIA